MKTRSGQPEGGTEHDEKRREVLAHASETFGSDVKADHWLKQSLAIFQGRTPLEVLETDPDAVETILTRIEHDIPS